MVYNLMSCGNFTGFSCSIAWFIVAILVFLTLIIRRQSENFGYGFNVIGGFAGWIIPFLLLITFTGSEKWSLAGGLIGLAVGGFLIGQFFGGGGDEYG